MNDYDKGREIKLSEKFKDTETYYDYRGFFLSPIGAAFVETYPQYKEVNGFATTSEWSEFCRGWNSVYWDDQAKLHKKYAVDEFLAELKSLCLRYDVAIHADEGDPWLVVKDYTFTISTPFPNEK